MALLARRPLSEPSSAYQGALYTSGLIGDGVDTPAYEAGTFLPANPFYGGMRPQTTRILRGLPWLKKTKDLCSYMAEISIHIKL